MPETGEWDAEEIALKIANELLNTLNKTTRYEYNDPLTKLKGELSAYKHDFENSPIQGLYVKHNQGHHPAQIETISARFRENIDNLLWIYVYGEQSDEAYLYTSEEEVNGLVKRLNRLNKSDVETPK